MARIDLNCDLGEGGGHDAELMALISSANIACGLHAGDGATMRATVNLAQRHGVAIGAHPSLNDRENFGRREWAVSPQEVHRDVVAQIKRLRLIAQECGARVGHVKPHGALYNMAAREPELAEAVAKAVYEVDPALVLVGLAGSGLLEAGRRRGLQVASEVFADRTYLASGFLTPRTEAEALITDEAVAVAQVLRLVREGVVRAKDGREVCVEADTICLHGDGASALGFAQKINAALQAAGYTIKALGA